VTNLPLPVLAIIDLGIIDQFTVNYIHLFALTQAALNTLLEKVDALPT
jgi:hypothetical protein